MAQVSIIIPNYNHAAYLKQRIDSVLAQTFQDFEIILLDDASQDQSREVIESYRSHSKIQIELNDSNSGCVFKQWNKGLDLARGEYVWIAESDDYSAPEFLETLVKKMEENSSVGLAFCDSFRVTGADVVPARERWFGEFAELYQRDFVENGPEYVSTQMLFFNTIPNASSVLFRRELAEQIGGADESFRLSGDWLFWIKLLKLSDIAYMATPLNFYRYHEQTARHANSNNGVMIEEAYRISLFVLKHFPVSVNDARVIDTRLTAWFVETMIGGRSTIPKPRQINIHSLAMQLNSFALFSLWLRRLGISWFWLGCRRRILTIWTMIFRLYADTPSLQKNKNPKD